MVQQMVTLYEKMKTVAGSLNIGGCVQIGAITSAQTELLGDALYIFKKKYPRVEVNIVPGMTTHIAARIDSGDIDVGIIVRPQHISKEFHWETLLREPYCIVAPPESTESTLKELLQNYQFIRLNRMSVGGRPVDRFLKRNNIYVKEGMELDEPAVIVKMVEIGLGVSIVPLWLATNKRKVRARVLSLGRLEFYREIGVLERQISSKTPLFLSLRQSFREAAKNVDQLIIDSTID
jgi:DNA-binding transcriptional LysR family regulator